jgi:hypothetical protein
VINGTTNAEDVVATTGAVYVLDGANKRIYLNTSAGSAAVQSRPLRTNTGQTLNSPKGMAIKGDSLYVVDASRRAIYRYSLAAAFTGTTNYSAVQAIGLPSTISAAEAVVVDNSFLYVLNNGTTKNFYRYTFAGVASATSRPLRTNTGGALTKPTGAVIEGTTMWVTDNGIDRALSYDFSQLFVGTTNLSATSLRLLNSGNLNATGITLVSNTSLIRTTEDGTTPSVSDATSEESFTVKAYPNPTGGVLNVLVDGLNVEEACVVRVVDMTGRVVAERTIEQGVNSSEPTFDLSGLKTGIYMVVIDQGDIRQTVRIVLQ